MDKLVRVRRLLDRLEFLNELPERLAVMISHKKYIEAVQLYNKTITVLTRHSHVLSFQKIKVGVLYMCMYVYYDLYNIHCTSTTTLYPIHYTIHGTLHYVLFTTLYIYYYTISYSLYYTLYYTPLTILLFH